MIWWRAIRSYSLPASIVPVTVGSGYAHYCGTPWQWGVFALTLAAGMLYQIGCNLVNDYFDFRYGVDRPGAFGGSGVLVSGELQPWQVLLGAALCLASGSAIGIYFVTRFGWPLLLVGLAGLLAAVFYTATPASAKYNAAGEPLVFLTMGVLMVAGGHLTQSGTWSWNAVLLSLPVSFLVTANLQANDTRDIAFDAASGVRTIAVLLGPAGARRFYSLLLAGGYLSLVTITIAGIAPPSALLALLTAPQAWALHRLFQHETAAAAPALVGSVERTAKLHLSFGVLLTLGLLLGSPV